MAGDVQVTVAYDYLSRRVTKRVSVYDPNASPAWVLTKNRRFIWDGWLMLREIEGGVGVPPANPTIVATYLWGLDPAGQAGAGGQGGAGILPASGSTAFLTQAGGIGGLIAVNIAQPEPNTPGGTFIYCYDGNGNVAQLVRPINGALSAKYDYDPYGTRVNAAAAGEAVQPWRFSTKQLDAETGLQYYGYRYRDRERWISRDPLEDFSGSSYGFVENSPVSVLDPHGLLPDKTEGGGAAVDLSPNLQPKTPRQRALEALNALRREFHGTCLQPVVAPLLDRLRAALISQVARARYANGAPTYYRRSNSLHIPEGVAGSSMLHELVHAYIDMTQQDVSESQDEMMAHAIQGLFDNVLPAFIAIERSIGFGCPTEDVAEHDWNNGWARYRELFFETEWKTKGMAEGTERIADVSLVSRALRMLGVSFDCESLAHCYTEKLLASGCGCVRFDCDHDTSPRNCRAGVWDMTNLVDAP